MIYHSTLVQCNVSIGLNLNLQNSYIVQTNSNFKCSFFPMKFSQCALSFVSIYAIPMPTTSLQSSKLQTKCKRTPILVLIFSNIDGIVLLHLYKFFIPDDYDEIFVCTSSPQSPKFHTNSNEFFFQFFSFSICMESLLYIDMEFERS